ncbi:MAG: penicillin acylase family protein, partial [Bacteroidota bacterium]
MMLRFYCFCLGLLPIILSAQGVDPGSITIVRDVWGVPHIKAPTHRATAYGLAWATCEDDFQTVQYQLLAVRGRLAEVAGKEGAPLDIVGQYLMLDELMEREFPGNLSPEFQRVLLAYCRGVNTYAREHPDEVLRPLLFPVGPRDVLKGYALGQALLTGAARALGEIMNDHLPMEPPRGSNAIAVNRERSGEETTHLIINSHQPLEGLFSWYEAHLVNDEGLNIHGATFPGGISIFHGANAHLGWAHTVNKPDFADIYRLEMHPDGRLAYRFDGEWLPLEKHKAKTRVKFGPIRLPVSKTFYKSRHGLVLKTKSGYYALRIVANQDIRGAEQWWRMNQATNLAEFKEALGIQGIAGTNIIYADAEDHIFYISNGRFPDRDPAFNWTGVLPGDTSAALWSAEPMSLDKLAQIQDPSSGFLYNTNTSPFQATGAGDNLSPRAYPAHMGYE